MTAEIFIFIVVGRLISTSAGQMRRICLLIFLMDYQWGPAGTNPGPLVWWAEENKKVLVAWHQTALGPFFSVKRPASPWKVRREMLYYLSMKVMNWKPSFKKKTLTSVFCSTLEYFGKCDQDFEHGTGSLHDVAWYTRVAGSISKMPGALG